MGTSRSAPDGTVTFLFTDIEGSTELWERWPTQMRDAVARHDAILREIADREGGYVFTTAGDSFAIAFSEAGPAITMAVDAQRQLVAVTHDEMGPLQVRMGAHTGSAQLRDGDYFGADVNLAARVMSAAHGGQVVTTPSTADLAGIDALDLGEHVLKGIARPTRLVQVIAPGLETEFPPLRSVGTPTNIPTPIDEFVGREDELTQTQLLVDTCRVVTLTGSGGAGKTRLAVEVARRRDHPGGVWFVDLSAVEAGGLDTAIASAIGLRESAGRAVIDQVVAHMRNLDALLVIDNCEHVIDEAAELVHALVRSCADIRIMCTSREALDIPGETVQTIAPLALPDGGDPGAMLDAASMKLLSDRARSARPGEDPVADDVDGAARVCRLVDGLPLAIELAAARLRTLSVPQLADRLAERLSVLEARRGRIARHRTLDAVVDWSYGLLPIEARTAFDRAAVFRGGFTREAAERVVAGAGPGDVVVDVQRTDDLLFELVDKSLLAIDRGDGRFRMLETMRVFGLARLDDTGPGGRYEVETRHLAWALDSVSALEASMRTERQDAMLQAARADQDNFRTARRHALDRGETLSALRITASVPLDPPTERPAVLLDLLQRVDDVPPELEARVRYTVAGSRFEAGDFGGGYPHARRATELFGHLGDRSQEAYGKMITAFLAWGIDAAPVDDLIDDALATFESLDDTLGRAYLSWLKAQRMVRGVEVDDAALSLARASVSLFGSVDAPFAAAHGHEGLGLVLAAVGKYHEGKREVIEAAKELLALGEIGCVAHTLDAVAGILVSEGDLVSGARVVGLAERLRDETGAAQRPWEIEATQACHRRLEVEFTDTELRRLMRDGGGLRPNAVIERLLDGEPIEID